MADEQNWSWAHAETAPIIPVGAEKVAALLVVHRSERYLARTLVALDRLETRPGRVIAVLNDEADDKCRPILDKALGEGLLDEVLIGSPTQTPGKAWQQAVDTLDEDHEWLWLLHDDVEPRRDCFDQLLLAGASEPRPDLVFPKLLQPVRRNHPDRLAEVGQTMTPSGARLTTIDEGDLDQAQLTSTEVLGGSTAGLFIRRQAMAALDGFTEAIPLHRDGVDLGWRANLAGMRVVTEPDAALHHREAGRRGERDSELEISPELTDRLMGMRLAAAHAARPAVTEILLVLGACCAAFGMLLAKSPTRARETWRAGTTFWRTRDQVAPIRERSLAAGSGDVSRLLPSRSSSVLSFLDRAASSVSDRFRSDDHDEETSIDDLTGDEFTGGRNAIHALRPFATVLFLSVVASLVAGRRMLGLGDLSGPQLLPAPVDLDSAWNAWLHPQPGVAGDQVPWLFLQALGSTLALGRPALWALVQQALAVPFAMLAAVPLAARLVDGPREPGRRRRRRSWTVMLVALAWGLLLSISGVIGRGNVGALVLSVVLSLLGWVWLTWWDQETTGVERWRRPSMFALLLAVACACTPVLFLPAMAAAVVVARRRKHWAALVLVALGPVVLLAPWLPRLFDAPSRLLTSTDPLAVVESTQWPVLAFLGGAVRTGGTPIAVVVVIGLLLWGLALLSAMTEDDEDAPLFSGRLLVLALAGACLVIAVWLPRVHLSLDGQLVRPDADSWQLLGLGLLLSLIALALRPGSVHLRALTRALLALVLVATGSWLVVGSHAVERTHPLLPAHVIAVQNSGRDTRALMVDLTTSTTRWQLASAEYPQWGSGEQAALPEPLMTAAGQLASQMAVGSPSDELAQRAASLGIGHLWIRGASPDVVAALSNSQGLGPAETVDGATTWTVTGLVSPVRVVDADHPHGTPVPTGSVAAGKDNRTLVFADAADPRWRASLDGTPLEAADPVDGQQAFHLGATGGELERHTQQGPWWLVLQLLTLALGLVMAAPAMSDEDVVAPRHAADDEGRRTRRARD